MEAQTHGTAGIATDDASAQNIATNACQTEHISGQKNRETPRYKVVRRRSDIGYGFYLFFKRCFDIVSSILLFLVLCLPLGIILLVKWAEDATKPLYRLSIEDIPEGEPCDKKAPDVYRARDGKLVRCTLVPMSKEEEHKARTEAKEKGEKISTKPWYTSTRVGKDGKTFRMLKIRTMLPNAEGMKQQLIDAGLNETDEHFFKMEKDPRITKVGRFLRKFSIDELLQLLNIIKGDLSVIGPRSPLPNEVEKYNEYERQRLLVKGGLLCLWQIQHNRNSISFDEWVRLDLEYIEKQSFLLDMKILFKGAWMVLFDHSGQ